MKHTLIKRTSGNSIAVATFGLFDDCNNGYNNFSVNVEEWATSGDRSYGSHVDYENKRHYFVDGGYSPDLVKKHFPELSPILPVQSCDSFGFPCYPIMNYMYHLEQGNTKPLIEDLRMTDKECEAAKSLHKSAFIDLLFKKGSQYKKEVNEAIKSIEKAANTKVEIEDFVSPYMYNDIHYTMITEKEGWNIYKGKKPKSYPKY